MGKKNPIGEMHRPMGCIYRMLVSFRYVMHDLP